MYGGVAPAAVDAAQDDLYSGYDENQPLDADAQQAASPVGSLSSRPFTGGGANNRLVTGAPGTRGGEGIVPCGGGDQVWVRNHQCGPNPGY